MPKLTLKAARILQSSFEGRITSSHAAQPEFRGRPTVLIPASTEDVERALRLAQAANRRVFVRSGDSVSAADVSTSAASPPAAAAALSKSAAAIVSMEAFRAIDVEGHQITVGAAATTGDLAKKLVDIGLFLPLDDNPTQSIVSAVLSVETSPFLRSDAGFGPLRNAVVAAEVVPTAGARAGRARTVQHRALRDVLGGDRPVVITKLVFDAADPKSDETDRWTQAWTTAYERRSFAALCDEIFGAGREAVPERVDLSVRVTSAAYSLKLVIVRATGHGETDDRAAAAVVQAALGRAGLPVLDASRADGPATSVAAWMKTGPGESAPGEVQARFGSNTALRSFVGIRRTFLDAVDFTIGVSARTGRERAPGVRAWAELQLAPGGDLVARAQISDESADAKVAKEARRRMAAAIPADRITTTAAAARRAVVRRAPSRAVLRGVEVLPAHLSTLGFDLVSNHAGSDRIPGFRGEVFAAFDGRRYRSAIHQYAVSSYSSAVVAARMTPRLVARAEDARDVTTAVTFAAAHGLTVVTRSGGHQYCGLSSGGDTTLLLDMSLFTDVVFSPAKGAPTQVTVGPGVALKDVSAALRKRGVVLPHGECPLVNLGGHVQTGGIGHQLRSLGATLDWVRSFKMVTRDPLSTGTDVYTEREFTRPTAGGGIGAPTDSDVFRAVLGGGPSSWGVLTEITFDLVSDRQYPGSAGYSYPYPYIGVEDGFKVAMAQLRRWAQRQQAGTLPPGVDLFVSVISGDSPRPAVLFVETMSRDAAGVQEIKAVVDAVDDAVSVIARWAAHASSDLKGPARLSVIADDGVRKIGMTGLPSSGREFNLPYKKSLHITRTPFSQKFCDDFIALVDAAYNHSGLKVVFQTVIGGGEFLANGQRRTTHMQRRDALAQVVFDVFYEPGYEAVAEDFQRRMKGLLGSFSGGDDVRMLWGTFEDAGTSSTQLDMRRTDTQTFYYDSAAEYARLQQIKKYTDPRDLFHTSFTVQLP